MGLKPEQFKDAFEESLRVFPNESNLDDFSHLEFNATIQNWALDIFEACEKSGDDSGKIIIDLLRKHVTPLLTSEQLQELIK